MNPIKNYFYISMKLMLQFTLLEVGTYSYLHSSVFYETQVYFKKLGIMDFWYINILSRVKSINTPRNFWFS